MEKGSPKMENVHVCFGPILMKCAPAIKCVTKQQIFDTLHIDAQH